MPATGLKTTSRLLLRNSNVTVGNLYYLLSYSVQTSASQRSSTCIISRVSPNQISTSTNDGALNIVSCVSCCLFTTRTDGRYQKHQTSSSFLGRHNLVAIDTLRRRISISAVHDLTCTHGIRSPVRHIMTKELVFSEFGNPIEVIKIRERELPFLGARDVLVRMLAAPVNPTDIYSIQGIYPAQLSLPCVAGNEGVGVVDKIGQYVTCVSPGNKVVITTPAQGTWRTYAIFDESMLKIIPDGLGNIEAATLTVNPCTAYRMLTDFKPVRACGGVVIQNGANSACGQNVIQLCKAWGIQNINIVRKRCKIAELKSKLENLGATYVLTEEELQSTTIFKENLIQPCLALNCVGGKNATQMMKHLERYGCMVTYGGLSREPVIIPTSAFVFKKIVFCGYWMTAWNHYACNDAKDAMLSEIISLMLDAKLVAPAHKIVQFDSFYLALCKTLKGFQGNKYIINFS